MVDDERLWPEEVSVGEVIYPPGGAFGPRLQRNLQLIILHSGQMTVWIDDVPHTPLAAQSSSYPDDLALHWRGRTSDEWSPNAARSSHRECTPLHAYTSS